MFLIELTYKKPLDQVDAFLKEHVEFLDRNYAKKNLIFSGRKVPRTGGILLARVATLEAAEALIQEDPFHREGLADYRIVEFTPSKCDPGFQPFLP